MIEKLLFIGQAPSQRSDLAVPLGGICGRRIARLLEISYEEFIAGSDRTTLLKAYPARKTDGKWHSFDIKVARERADQIVIVHAGRRAILLGTNVAATFGLRIPYLGWVEHRGLKVAILPHPSGANVWWNARDNTTRARIFLRAAWRKQQCETSSQSGIASSAP